MYHSISEDIVPIIYEILLKSLNLVCTQVSEVTIKRYM